MKADYVYGLSKTGLWVVFITHLLTVGSTGSLAAGSPDPSSMPPVLAVPQPSSQSQAQPSRLFRNLYQYLTTRFPEGEGTFYSPLTPARLSGFIATPDFWGKSDLELAYFLQDPGRPRQNQEFLLPLCQSRRDCVSDNPSGVLGRCVFFPPAAQKVCVGQADPILDTLYQRMIKAKSSLDITSFDGNGYVSPDQRFIGLLRGVIAKLAATHRPITIRMLFGATPIGMKTAPMDPATFIRAIADPGQLGQLKIHVATLQTCYPSPPFSTPLATCTGPYGPLSQISFNHSKNFVIDGQTIIAGGINMSAQDYLTSNPIHDLSHIVTSPRIASSANRFHDRLWTFAENHQGYGVPPTSHPNSCASADASGYHQQCLTALPAAKTRATGPNNEHAIGISNAGVALTDDNRYTDLSGVARDYLLSHAQRTIHIFQQDLGFYNEDYKSLIGPKPLFPAPTLEKNGPNLIDILARKAIADQVKIHIVLSNFAAIGASGAEYSNHVSLADVAKVIHQSAVKQFSGMPTRQIEDSLCSNLYLSTIHFNQEQPTWSNFNKGEEHVLSGEDDKKSKDGKAIGLHSKFYAIDEHLFYIGSANFYPFNGQEYGLINDGRDNYQRLHKRFVRNVLKMSKPWAISGIPGPSACVFATQSIQ